ncbi:hypothetical protein LTR10_014086 [Elasticomyces elasticus]|uniref:DUF1682 domain protein n=1 Tax=Exophiala sideris TaxID=1016849 RepID=A0ABR0J3F2_9EURO|nr:hypothetical protein LTR10_014086 [Elasticomyces elasticus]KAK5026492.1 hypothetical protein LTS07_007426 [Exophiala sideris]KAK5033767.1 hypothetical protein LTR13_006819 [Exophiala sideris]KAK5055589.1 hypothetical protein LTR69_008422 [Exophiala sideris]KAK5180027.1 hypothetical protein LTR44_007503 [Eurotiomycetes sp. CCFEE 6388]
MDYFKSLVGGLQPSQAPVVAEDSDFADFAAAPPPSPASIPHSPADAQAAEPTAAPGDGVVYTKWYRVWERTKPSDFILEAVIIPIILVALLVHFWGTRRNRSRAKKWMAVHAPLLDREFALVGYNQVPKATPYSEGVQGDSLLAASAKLPGDNVPDDMLKEKAAWEYETYATGRQNVAFMDVKIFMKRWMNPVMMIAEEVAGLVSESVKPKPERMEAVLYTFDGKEKEFVPPPVPGSEETGKTKAVGNSTYDAFVFAVVNKLAMRKLREERYDLSLTFTKDSPKLPNWATVMSESGEVTDMMLTKDLIDAVTKAGDLLEYLIVTDQPTDKPTTLNETTPKKRLNLCLRLPSDGDYLSTLPIFQSFLRLPDFLVSSAKLRPEVLRKINAIREEEKSKLKRVSDREAEEERLKQLDKMKKEERDRKMRGMTAEEQRKFLDRESEKNRKKQEKKMTRRG